MSGRIVHLDADPHVAVQKLLPWYLGGQLDAAETASVQEHLASCAECRAELEAERQWQLLQAGDEAPADVAQGWAAMRLRLDEEAVVPPDPARRRRRGLAPAWPFAARRPHRAWLLPGLLSAALAVALVVTLRPVATPIGDFRAMAAPAQAATTAVVRFRPDATETQIRHALDDSGARLVDGPTVTDAYVVRLPREHDAAALARLRQQPGVSLVEALQGAPAP